MPKLNEEKKELERLKDLALSIYNYIDKLWGENRPIYFVMFKDAINKAYEEQNIRGMRTIVRDFKEWSRGMDQKQREELSDLLKENFGEGVIYNPKGVEAVLAKGYIEKLSEYRLLFEYFEDIYSDELKKDEAEKVRKILEQYQIKTGKV